MKKPVLSIDEPEPKKTPRAAIVDPGQSLGAF
jgi:hypothetical protein